MAFKKKKIQYLIYPPEEPLHCPHVFLIHWSCGKHFVWMLEEKKKCNVDTDDIYTAYTQTPVSDSLIWKRFSFITIP